MENDTEGVSGLRSNHIYLPISSSEGLYIQSLSGSIHLTTTMRSRCYMCVNVCMCLCVFVSLEAGPLSGVRRPSVSGSTSVVWYPQSCPYLVCNPAFY